MIFKNLAISNLKKGVIEICKRFPVEVALSLFSTLLLIILAHDATRVLEMFFVVKMLMVAILGFFLFLAITSFFEKEKHRILYKPLIYTVVLCGLVLYYVFLPAKEINILLGHYVFYWCLMLISILLVTFVPFFRVNEVYSFWIWIKKLFTRAFISFVYGLLLFIGLAVVLYSLDFLFGLDIKEYYYLQIWFCVIGIFMVGFFLSGVPSDYKKLDKEKVDPKYLKIFVQYIMIPLVSIYILILYGYSIKIFFIKKLPEGGVVRLIAWLSFVMLLLVIFMYHFLVKDKKDKKTKKNWVYKLYTIYFAAILPLMLLYFLAIFVRVMDYGVTVNRYFVIVYGMWLIAISVYFLLGKAKDIRIIPASLAIIIAASIVGPWSSFNISKNSQLDRLGIILKQEGILFNGKIYPTEKKINKEKLIDIASIIRYLGDYGYYNEMNKWFDVDLIQEISKTNKSFGRYADRYNEQNVILGLMGLEPIGRVITDHKSFDYYSQNDNQDGKYYDVEGYDLMLNFNVYSYLNNDQDIRQINYNLGVDNMKLIYDYDDFDLSVNFNGELLGIVGLKYYLETLVKENGLLTKYDMYIDDMTVEFDTDRFKIKIIFDDIKGEKNNEDLKINTLRGVVLMSIVE